MSNETKTVTRRTVAKGAAWSVPVVALGAGAAQAAASGEPTCPNCFKAGSIPTPVVSAATNTNGTAALFPWVATLNIDSTGCPLNLFRPAYTAIATNSTLTMTDGRSYTSNVGLGSGAGTFGQISAFAFAGNFSGVTLSRFPVVGTYPSNGIRPAKFCVDFNFILVGLPSLIQITCPQTLCWNVSSIPVGAGVGGVGVVTFTSTLSPA
ncbi:hypothetical protein [Flexivirga meconopsidis]|uniref:hypothetical protein n=1 Tax=Flexivirga meconopsidis TaxID=2977121 RepID=UPI00223F007A|nr:hypothetical protein [Flexivirga meconopsidis]